MGAIGGSEDGEGDARAGAIVACVGIGEIERVATVGEETTTSCSFFCALSLESMSSLEEGEDLFEGRKADKADLMALLGIDRRVPGVDGSLVGSAVVSIA